MKLAKLLILNSGSSREFAAALREILTTPPHPPLRLLHEVVEREGDLSPGDLARLMSELRPDLCFITLKPSARGPTGELLAALKTCAPGVCVIVGLEDGEPGHMVELLKLGAVDFITSPLRAIDILPRIWRWAEGAARPEARPLARAKSQELKHLIGRSDAFLAEVTKIPVIAECDAGVLITGETGTGKELFARAVHYLSLRARNPFVPVNCGAIPLELVENELFGHAPGAYTGASTFEFGVIREAEGGTIFLDELDCLPPQAQVKLLRFLQDKVYKPLGLTKSCAANVRVVAAMNTAPEEAINSGRLRRDLYYRLNVIPLRLPPLRERRDDILLLARHFLDKYVAEFGKPRRDFTAAAMRALNVYDWPGNIRELEHVIERAVVFSDRPLVDEVDILSAGGEGQPHPETFKEAKANLITQFEKTYIKDLLLANQGNVSRAARAAHKNRRALWHLIRKHNIDIDCIRTGAK